MERVIWWKHEKNISSMYEASPGNTSYTLNHRKKVFQGRIELNSYLGDIY